MKLLITTLFTVLAVLVTVCCAMEVSEDDVNSPLVSYLLAKVQRLESNMIRIGTAENKISRSRRTSTKPPDSGNKCDCPLTGVVTYTRWGNSTCPYGADTIYSGQVAGSWYAHEGAAVDPLCLPPDPEYLEYQSGAQTRALLYGAEYETSLIGPLNHVHDRDVPCALCQVYGRSEKIMIPSKTSCPTGWTREYYGYLMAGYHGHKAATQYTCMDESVEVIPGSGASNNGRLFFTVEIHDSRLPQFTSDYRELTCVVCTK